MVKLNTVLNDLPDNSSKLIILFIKDNESIISSNTAIEDPANDVLPPCGHIANLFWVQKERIFETSSVDFGLKTTLLEPVRKTEFKIRCVGPGYIPFTLYISNILLGNG